MCVLIAVSAENNIFYLLRQGSGYFWSSPFYPQQSTNHQGSFIYSVRWGLATYPRMVSHLWQSSCLCLQVLWYKHVPTRLAGSLSSTGTACRTAPQHSFFVTSAVAIFVHASKTSSLGTEQNGKIILPSSVGVDIVFQLLKGQEVGAEEGQGLGKSIIHSQSWYLNLKVNPTPTLERVLRLTRLSIRIIVLLENCPRQSTKLFLGSQLCQAVDQVWTC